MFKDYCAACHGVDGKGNGPAVAFLKTSPPNLRMMAQRNNGKYRDAHVLSMLNFGHGDIDMPTWGPMFRSLEHDRNLADLRVHNLAEFIKSIQDK
jgi:mono/diheme cytochrome c family protein